MKKMLLLLTMSTLIVNAKPATSSSTYSPIIKTVLRKGIAASECLLGTALLFYASCLLPGKAGSMLFQDFDGGMWKLYTGVTTVSIGLLLHGIQGLRKQSEKPDNKK